MNTNTNTASESLCPICGRSAAAPYRRIVGGAIVEGCVDKFHDGALSRPSNTAAWHDRPEARKIRAKMRALLA